MADSIREGYDTSVGTSDRSAVAATKIWGVVLGIVLLLGILMLALFLFKGSTPSSGGVSSENTATRPAEP